MRGKATSLMKVFRKAWLRKSACFLTVALLALLDFGLDVAYAAAVDVSGTSSYTEVRSCEL